jgi:TRAP-type C4-dicarboxylate transport system permease small subunit
VFLSGVYSRTLSLRSPQARILKGGGRYVVKAVEQFIFKVFEGVGIFLTGFMTLAVIISVFLRYCFNISFVWAEEAITYMFIGTTFFGAVVCQKQKEHIQIDFFKRLFSKPVKKVVTVIGYIVTIIVLGFLLKISCEWIALTGNSISTGVMLPFKCFYIMVPISAAGMIFFTLRHLIDMLSRKSDTQDR